MGVVDDLRYAVRSLVRRPSVTIFAVLTIALGIGATTAMFGTVEAVVLNPIPYENADRMVGLFSRIGNADAGACIGPGQNIGRIAVHGRPVYCFFYAEADC